MDVSELLLDPPQNGQHDNPIVNAPRFARKTLKVAIVGKAPSTINLAPFGDESWEIWGLSSGAEAYPRWDRWFEIHPIEINWDRWPASYKTWIQRDHGKPIYLQEPSARVPHGVIYPRQEIQAAFGDYFTNSISWMLALAIHEGATDISLFGVDMATSDPATGQNGEYQYQRPSCEYFIGLAVGRGIRVGVPEASDLMKTASLYGLDANGEAYRRKMIVRERELQQRIAQHEAQATQHQAKALGLRGALGELLFQRQWHP